MRRNWRSSDWVLLARDGTPLQRTRVDLTERRGDWVSLADVSPAFREAIVVSEDKRFYEHSGVDWRGIAGAAWGNLWNERTRGASTVTMQLAGLLSDSPRRSGQRSLPQKASQAVNALLLERGWRKDQVLEAFRILLDSPRVHAVLVNIFGGIMKCDIIASALLAAYDEIDFRVPLVVRLEGTNSDLGKELLDKSGRKIITADGLTDAAQKVVAAAKGHAAA